MSIWNKNTLLILALAVIAGQWTAHRIASARQERLLADATEAVLRQGEMIELAEGLSEAQAIELGNQRQLVRALQDSLPALAERNRLLNRRLQTWSQLVAYYESVSDTIEVIRPPLPDSGRGGAMFALKEELNFASYIEWAEGPANLAVAAGMHIHTRGVTVDYSMSWTGAKIKIEHDPFVVNAVLSQDPSGNWVASWRVPPYLRIDKIQTQVVPLQRRFLDRLSLAYGGTTRLQAFVGLGYDHWQLGALVGPEGGALALWHQASFAKLFGIR